MPRAIWSGAISFGLVTIPVKLFNGVSKKSVRFNQLDSRTGARIKRKWISALDETDVPSDVLVRGYEISSGNYVTISDDELDSVDPKASRSIDIIEFVDLDEIDPVIYDSAYFLVPDELAAKAYMVLVEALEEANKVAIAKLVMRTKQYVAAIRPSDGHLKLSTMVFADEVNEFSELDGIEHLADIEVRDAEIDMAKALIDSLSAEFDHEKFSDEHRERIMEMIARKSDGEIVVTEAPVVSDDNKVVDLMAALEASVAAAKEARGRHPSASDESGAGQKTAAAKKKPAKKTTKKKSAPKKSAPKSASKTAGKAASKAATAKKAS